jgi:hypothetical protein
MNRTGSTWRTGLVAIALAVAWPGLARVEAAPDEAAFRRDLEILTARPQRLAGREDGSRAASRHVEQRLRAMGVAEIYVQEFPVQQPRMRECILEADGASYPLYAVRPNVLQASVTPAAGLSGDTVYLGRGTLADFSTNALMGRVAVMDFDCGEEWIKAFAYGAIAVLFVEQPGQQAQPLHHVEVPANLPRFYVPAETAAKLALTGPWRRVRVRAACTWEALRGRNVIGVIRGTAATGPAGRAEAVVLAAPLDAFSEVPELSPGARDAGNAAALLHVAERLCANRPRRDVVLAFLDGQACSHAGARAFYAALYRRMGVRKLADSTLEDRLAMVDSEERHLRNILAVLAQADLFDARTRRMDGYLEALRKVRAVAFKRSGELLRQIGPLRLQLGRLRDSPEADRPEVQAEILALTGDAAHLGRIDELRMGDLAWNSILRCTDEGRMPDETRMARLAAKLVTAPDEASLELNRAYFLARLSKGFADAMEEARQNCTQRLDELAMRRDETRASLALRDALGAPRENLVLHLSLNLGGDGEKWSFMHGDIYGPLVEDSEGLYANIFRAIRESRQHLEAETPRFDPQPAAELYPSSNFAPTPYTDSAGIARLFAQYNLSIMTVFDPLTQQGLPSDRLEALDQGRLFAQAVEVGRLLPRLIEHDRLGKDVPQRAEVFFDEERWAGKKAIGHAVRQVEGGDPMQAGIVSGALVAAIPVRGATAWRSPPLRSQPRGFIPELIVRSQSNGNFEVPPVARTWKWPMLGVDFDAEGRGIIQRVTAMASFGLIYQRYVHLIDVRSMTVAGWGFERLAPTTVMHALATAKLQADRHLVCEQGNLLVLFAPPEVSAAKLFNANGLVMLNNDASPTNYTGTGMALADPFARVASSAATASDLLNLNDYRLRLLRGARIVEPSLEALHGRAGDIRADAAGIHEGGRRQSMLAASAAYSRQLYGPLIGVMKDLVSAVVVLLLLALPFAFALERLLVGSPHIYRRLGWFAGFFLATFALMYQVNPAFKLSATPAIIFLAFTVMLLSLMVIFIMTRKLRTELKRMQGLSATAHSADVSRLSTMAAAVSMGISTMRRRPLRTLLTAVTVVLLTFTILTFASFSNVWGNRRTYLGPLPDGPARILVRHVLWSPLAADVPAMLHGFLSGRAEVVPRYWVSPAASDVAEAATENRSLERLVSSADGRRVATLSAAVGVHVVDLARDVGLKANVATNARLDLLAGDGILLSRAVSETLGLDASSVGRARVRFGGQNLTYAGAFEPGLSAQVQMDGSSVLPVDYKASLGGGAELAQTVLQQTESGSSASFVPYPADGVALLSADVAVRMGGQIRSLTIYPVDRAALDAIASDVAVLTGLPTFLGGTGGVNRLQFSMLVAASGFRDLAVPIVLGGLIIFATMLGSVVDREREIWTFSSLGLAPPHVAMLFFAESAVYAVVGGMGGYLLGQVSTHLLAVIGRWGHFAVPAMNFSSMNAVAAILIVMGIVVLSTLYPALKASRSANSGVQRVWRMPAPQGDRLDILFPFTVSAYDLVGIVSYLEEHFQNFSDAAIGSFATVSCRVFRQQESDTLGFEACVALAPFDLGIEQRMVMLSQPGDVEGIHEVRVWLRCTGGALGDWRRANRVFVGELRRQFLLWRTLDESSTRIYRERTLGRWESLAIERRDVLLAMDEGKGRA